MEVEYSCNTSIGSEVFKTISEICVNGSNTDNVECNRNDNTISLLLRYLAESEPESVKNLPTPQTWNSVHSI